MTRQIDVERVLDAFLAPDHDVIPDRVIDAALGEIARSPQPRAMRGPRRFQVMPSVPRGAMIAAATLVLLVIGGGAIYVAGQRPPANPIAPTPGTSPSATPTATPSTAPTPSTTAQAGLHDFLGLTVGPGMPGSGTIVFGIHDRQTDTNRLYAISPDGTLGAALPMSTPEPPASSVAPPGAHCCLVLAPDGRAALAAAVVEGRLVPTVLALPVATSFSETPWIDFAPGINLRPGAWSVRYDLAFEGYADGKPDVTGIYLSVANGGGLLRGNLARLTSNPGTNHDIPVAFSPDGSRLMFVRETQPNERTGDLYVIGLDGSGLRVLNPPDVGVKVDEVFGAGASWSPDGTRVAFSAFDRSDSGYDTTSRAYVVDAGGGAATVISPDSTFMTSARWSPDGTWIAYDDGNAPRDVWVVRPDGSDAHQVTRTEGSCCAVWSPDSSMLMFEGNDANGAGIFIARVDGSGYGQLINLDSEYDLRWRSWGPGQVQAP